MRTATPALALAAILGVCFGPSARADLTLAMSNATSSSVEFIGSGTGATFQFNNNSSGQGFKVTSSSSGTGSNTAVGLSGTLGGTYSYTTASIVTNGSTQTALVTTNNGSLTISDGTNLLTGTVTGVNVSTTGVLGVVDMSGAINLTNVSYSGTNADLLKLMNEAKGNGGVVTISFQFLPAKTLTQLAASGSDKKTSYSGSIATTVAPEPSSLAITGIAALGMIGFGLRRRNAPGI
jgi:hypothetical protein